MAIYAIADLHLSHAQPKSMAVFGEVWENHWQRIQQAWKARIDVDDLVLIPGDISWAMHIESAKVDIDAIGAMPGKKLILRGNHDYWWSSLSKVRGILPQGMYALQNDCFVYRGHAICGARGWVVPGSKLFQAEDEKLYLREIGRLKLSLQAAKKQGVPIALVMMHYPPFNDKREDNGFTELFKTYDVQRVIYGHLHGVALTYAFEGEHDGIRYEIVSCDHLGFVPKRIVPDDELN